MGKSKHHVKQLYTESDYDGEFLFGVNAYGTNTALHLEIGGVATNFIIDSGATVHVLDQECWKTLK